MYQDKLVAVIRCNGEILREIDDVVTLPFGSEYNILMKNLDSRKVQVGITIDGRDILDNKKLVIDGGKEAELEGYMDGFSAKHKFKFIQKTKEIANHRGDKVDDGIIRVEFQYEKKVVSQRIRAENICSHHYDDPIVMYNNTPKPDFFNQERSICGDTKAFRSSDGIGSTEFSNNSSMGMSKKLDSKMSRRTKFKGFMDNPTPQPLEDEGITVKGSQCNQQFREVWMNELEEASSVIIIKLRGYTGKQKIVRKPITVKTKIQCETCGRSWRSWIKFCPNCGTSLI